MHDPAAGADGGHSFIGISGVSCRSVYRKGGRRADGGDWASETGDDRVYCSADSVLAAAAGGQQGKRSGLSCSISSGIPGNHGAFGRRKLSGSIYPAVIRTLRGMACRVFVDRNGWGEKKEM